MKKLIVSTLTVAIFATLSLSAQAQSGTAKKSLQHKVGLIDMAHVFKEYKKFNSLREGLKGEIATSDTEAKSKAASIQKSLRSLGRKRGVC